MPCTGGMQLEHTECLSSLPPTGPDASVAEIRKDPAQRRQEPAKSVAQECRYDTGPQRGMNDSTHMYSRRCTVGQYLPAAMHVKSFSPKLILSSL